MINDIRNYFNRLIKNTKNDNIKFFSDIELGEFKDNPHLHIQVWHDNQKQIDKIYNKIIDRFGLNDEFCRLTMPKDDRAIYDYVVKDYRKELTNDELLSLYDAKRTMRGVLGKKIRFSSHSKGKHTKAIYKKLYSKFNLKKDMCDLLLDGCVIDIQGSITNEAIYAFCYMLFTNFKTINNKRVKPSEYEKNLTLFQYTFLYEWWVYGRMWEI